MLPILSIVFSYEIEIKRVIKEVREQELNVLCTVNYL